MCFLFKKVVVGLFCVLLCVGILAGCDDTVPVNAPVDDTEDTGGDSVSDTVPVSDTDTDTESDPPLTDEGTAPDEFPDESPATEPETEPVTEPPVIRIEVPSPIGRNISDLGEIPFPEEQMLFVPANHPLPIGTVFEVTFVGEREGDVLYIAPESLLVLHVSEGIDLENVTVSAEDKTVYLTFDDGPSPANTPRVLDILDEYGVKATFFLVGESVEKYPDLVREIYSRGHKIGCHSFTHVYADIYANVENMQAEIARWEAAVENALGFLPAERLFRFPGGSTICKEDGIRKMLAEQGWRAYDWNAVNNDCLLHTRPEEMTDEEYMKDSVISTLAYSFRMSTSPHIMLMHDTYVQTADLLPWMIEYMKEQGCTFGTLDQLESGWLHRG